METIFDHWIRGNHACSEEPRWSIIRNVLHWVGSHANGLDTFFDRVSRLRSSLSQTPIALKEANETEYWLSLLKDTDFISEDQFESLQSDCKELIAMLVSTVKTSKNEK